MGSDGFRSLVGLWSCCTRNGKPLAAGNVRRAFRSITKAAGVGEDRHQLRPVIETGATAMNAILNRQKNAGSG